MLGRLLRSVLVFGAASIATKALQRYLKRPAAGEGVPRAHQADGTDASASFAAGIADENTVPESTASFGDTPGRG